MLSEGTCEDSKIKPTSEEYSLSAEHRGRDSPGQPKEAREREALTLCRAQGGRFIRTAKGGLRARGNSRSVEHRVRDMSAQRKKASGREALTLCQAKSDGFVKESQQSRSTHNLSNGEEEKGQDHGIKQAGEGHSRPVERRGRDSSGQQNKASERRALAFCRAKSEGAVRTAKES
jgi:hypothetical protein